MTPNEIHDLFCMVWPIIAMAAFAGGLHWGHALGVKHEKERPKQEEK